MNVSVIGLGYVGAVSAACFAREGHNVIGVDISRTKVDIINAGRSPIVEEGIDDLIREMRNAKRLSATTDIANPVKETEISLVCVGTPSNENGSLKLDHIAHVSQEIGEAIRDKAAKHTVVVRSTMLPGTVEELVIPTIEKASGKVSGEGFDVCVNPEFLREGTSIKDFYAPRFTVIGADSAEASEKLASLYCGIDAPLYKCGVTVAEMVKYACNSFHGLKVAFANEIGNVCKELNIDSHEVMELFCRDTKLNLSSYYLKPGFAFGGSCLPKDLRALQYKARQLDLSVPVIEAVTASNSKQVIRAVEMIGRLGKRRIGVLGFAFKAGTDDLRESPVVLLIEQLIGKGFDLKLYDEKVALSRLVGANKAYIEHEIPHISSLMTETVDEIMDHSDVIVIGNAAAEFGDIRGRLRQGQRIVDLVRAFGPAVSGDGYHGICW